MDHVWRCSQGKPTVECFHPLLDQLSMTSSNFRLPSAHCTLDPHYATLECTLETIAASTPRTESSGLLLSKVEKKTFCYHPILYSNLKIYRFPFCSVQFSVSRHCCIVRHLWRGGNHLYYQPCGVAHHLYREGRPGTLPCRGYAFIYLRVNRSYDVAMSTAPLLSRFFYS